MVGVVFCFRHDHEVGDHVVPGILVLVVNKLGRQQKAPDVLLHYEPMLHDIALRVGVRMVRREHGEVSSAAPVGNPSLIPGVCRAANIHALPKRLALRSAELLRPLARLRYVRAALTTSIRRRFSKAPKPITLGRTYRLRLFGAAAIRRMKWLLANFTQESNVQVSHVHSITREERYCEIAAKRMKLRDWASWLAVGLFLLGVITRDTNTIAVGGFSFLMLRTAR